MPSSNELKTASGEALKGRLKVTHLMSIATEFRYAGKRHYLSTGLSDTVAGRIAAQQKANQIQLDILSGSFDSTLAKSQPTPMAALANAVTRLAPLTSSGF